MQDCSNSSASAMELLQSCTKPLIHIDILSTFHETAPEWMFQDHINDRSTLVQVMTWCRQAPSHYLSQCWPRSMSPWSITRPQWVKEEASSCPFRILVDSVSMSHGMRWYIDDICHRYLEQGCQVLLNLVVCLGNFISLIYRLYWGNILETMAKISKFVII